MKKTTLAMLMAVTAIATGFPRQRENATTQPQDSIGSTQNIATDDSVSNAGEEPIHMNVEEQAAFPGGMQGMMKFLSKNMRYPENAVKNNVQGRVFVQFIVEKDGTVSEAKVKESVDPDLDEEALRIVNKMPKWIPGKLNGEPVRSYFTFPVNFRLEVKKIK